MRALARFQLPDGTPVDLGHGDLIGRLWSCTLLLDDPRISEAHALVSQRGHELKLLALRGRFALDGKPLAELTLRTGQRVELAGGLVLTVLDVVIPTHILGLETAGLPPRALPGTCALVVAPEPGLAPAGHPDAVAALWAVPEGWRVRVGDGSVVPIDEGASFEAGGRTWTAVAVPVSGASADTRFDPLLEAPLRLVARYDTVHVFRDGQLPGVIHGQSARLVSELVALAGPVAWTLVAEQLWPDGGTRKQFDMALVRLRQRLRTLRVRTDLVRTDGAGTVELFLRPGDRLEDHT